MSTPEIETLQRALVKRGFKQDDLYFHECAKCSVRAVRKFTLQGKLGGRDIDLCLDCGHSRSWSRRDNTSDRVEDAEFDLKVFLRL
jgi:hypothetical protein